MSADPNRYTVEVRAEDGSWQVEILDPRGQTAATRACGSEREAALYASSVRQHLGWLSERRFREYYRLPEPPEG